LAILFVFQVLYLLAEGVESADIVGGDGTAFLLCPQVFCLWAGKEDRGSADSRGP
jgi:hypothetical protein